MFIVASINVYLSFICKKGKVIYYFFAGNMSVSVLRFKIEIYSSHINLRAKENIFNQIGDNFLNFKSLEEGLMLLERRMNLHFTRGLKRVPWDTVGKKTAGLILYTDLFIPSFRILVRSVLGFRLRISAAPFLPSIFHLV